MLIQVQEGRQDLAVLATFKVKLVAEGAVTLGYL